MAHRKRAAAGTLTVAGVEYVVIPRAEYLRLLDKQVPMGAVDARTFVRQSIGADLRAAREAAGLTQAQLARRMRKSQPLISQAESGTARVSERYVRAVLTACGLPADWRGTKAKQRSGARKKRV
jgi:ribosome-binding protein aMBF1 (putative translation factor)